METVQHSACCWSTYICNVLRPHVLRDVSEHLFATHALQKDAITFGSRLRTRIHRALVREVVVFFAAHPRHNRD